jgi:hypothetical protein
MGQIKGITSSSSYPSHNTTISTAATKWANKQGDQAPATTPVSAFIIVAAAKTIHH